MSAVGGAVLRFKSWWAQRAPRERHMLLAMLAVLGLGVGLGLADWIQTEQKRLARTLPQARISYAAVQDAAEELAKLKNLAKRPVPPADHLLTQLKTSSTARGLTLVLESNGEMVYGKGKVNFASLVLWLGEVQRDFGLGVRDIEVLSEGSLSVVDFRLSLTNKGR